MAHPQRTVLIVDDCAEDRYTYRRYLLNCQECDYTIQEAESGTEALEICSQTQPDGILIDFLLPDLNGLELLKQLQIQLNEFALPVIILTGQGNEAIAVQVMKAGAQDYLVKGQITPEDLRLAVDSVIEKSQLRAQLKASEERLKLAEAERRERIGREKIISDIAQRIRQTLDLAQVLNKTVVEVREFLRCDRVFIYRFNSDWSGVIEVESLGEGWKSILAERVEDSCFQTTQGEDYRLGRIQAIDDIYTAGLTECYIGLLSRFQVRANLVVPILQGESLWGLMVANHCAEARLWQPLEIDLLKQLATQVGIAIQQSEYHQRVQSELIERQRAEVALQSALQKLNFHVENSPLAVIEWDGNLRVTRWSREAEKIFGWSAEEVLGKRATDWQFLVAEDAATVEAAMQIFVGKSKQIKSCNRNYAKDGSIVHCEWYNSTLSDADGKLVSMLSLVLNISDRVRLEQERDRILQQEQVAREQAEAANRVKDQFLAVLSHELRTPLNPILGWSKLLQTGKVEPAKAKVALATIERNAKLQCQLIEDLLDVSRILRGKLALQVSVVNLTATIEAALETVRLAAEAKSIEIQTVFSETTLLVSGDAGRLQQVVWNLLSNAVKFTNQKGRVEVYLKQVDSDAQIQVVDTGKGINADFLPHVFDYFRQEDGATTRKFGGLGLGLAIVRQIVELHGGTVGVESLGEEKGATFTVRLPLLKADRGIKQESTSSSLIVRSLPLAGLQVLVVDDNTDAREFIAFVLEQDGAQVTTAASASAALQILAQSRPDILVSDIGMPEMNGYELIEQVRSWKAEQGGTIPALALTAYAGEYDQKQALSAGFGHHLSKPVDPIELVNTVARLAMKQPLIT